MTNHSGTQSDLGEIISLLPPSQRGGQASLETLWQKLRPANPVQQIARKVMSDGKEVVTRADVERLLDALEQTRAKPLWSREVIFWLLGGSSVSPEHTEREATIWALAHLRLPSDLQARAGTLLARILAGEGLRNRHDDPIVIGKGFLRGILLFVAATPLMLPAIGEIRNPTLLAGFTLILGMVAVYASCFSPLFIGIAYKQNKDHLKWLRFSAAMTLGPLGRPEAIYALAAAADEYSKDNLPQTALHSLKQTLPAILPEHYGTLPAATIPNLCALLNPMSAFLNPFGNQELSLQILYALEKVGDGRAVAPVKAFAEKATGTAGEEAWRILPILQARQQAEQESGMLLRGASALSEAQSAGVLLRAAQASAVETSGEKLLRPR